MKRYPLFARALLLGLAATLALAWAGPAPAADRPLVVVSIPPQRYFVTAIAGDAVDVAVMVRPGASPATYEPTPNQVAALSRAKAYLAIGVPFEAAWLERFAAANPAMAVTHMERGIRKAPMAAHAHALEDDHGHGQDHDGDHGVLDPHVWLSPALAATLAENTCQALEGAAPDHGPEFRANLAALLGRIETLDADIHAILDPLPPAHRAFMVFHPSWGYFASQYGLRQMAIEAGGKEPGPRELAALVRRGRELGITVVFVQPQFSQKSASVIAAELGARVQPLDPLAEDWADNLLRAARAFRRDLAPGDTP